MNELKINDLVFILSLVKEYRLLPTQGSSRHYDNYMKGAVYLSHTNPAIVRDIGRKEITVDVLERSDEKKLKDDNKDVYKIDEINYKVHRKNHRISKNLVKPLTFF